MILWNYAHPIVSASRAHNEAANLGYDLFHWRTRAGAEVDLVLYGERGLHAFEVKRSSRVRSEDLKGLRLFQHDYPPAQLWLLYGGERAYLDDGVAVLPFGEGLRRLPAILAGAGSIGGQTPS